MNSQPQTVRLDETGSVSAFTHLLPLRGADMTLRFLADTEINGFHQPALSGFLRSLLGGPEAYDTLLTVDAPESGRSVYHAGDCYRFTVFALRDGDALLTALMMRLRRLPDSAAGIPRAGPFGANVEWVGARDFLNGTPVDDARGLCEYDAADLDTEVAVWRNAPSPLVLRWLSPVRWLKAKGKRRERGEARYCRDADDIPAGLWVERVHDGIADLVSRRGEPRPGRGPMPAASLAGSDLFWIRAGYTDRAGRWQVMGGMAGRIVFRPEEPWPDDLWRLLVLGQYVGVGQRRAFGWGRYRLEVTEGSHTCPRAERAQPLWDPVTEARNLREAFLRVRANRGNRNRAGRSRPQATFAATWETLPVVEPEPEDDPGALERLGRRLRSGEHRPSVLQAVVSKKANGEPRVLAVPNFWDRVAQRAVIQVLSPVLEQFMHGASHGYRPGRSRHTAAEAIRQAYRDGYRWVYECDIDDFFDRVDWDRLEVRLRAFLGEDSLVAQIMAWVRAPVEYEDRIYERVAGLPQGAPVSPLLANLMLDDFDSDLDRSGFRLVRYADDFVVLCKDREDAEAAAAEVRRSLEEKGLTINAAKSGVRDFDQGFRFLGYVLMRDLALDVGGERRASPAVPGTGGDAPPGWLARLTERAGALLDPGGGWSVPEPDEESGDNPKQEGSTRLEATGEAWGGVVIVSGAPCMLSTRDGRLKVERDDAPVVDRPWSQLRSVVLFGRHHVTTPAMKAAMADRVPIHFARASGVYEGVLASGVPGSEGPGLWLQQHARFADPGAAVSAARTVVEARIRHQREILRRYDDALMAPHRQAMRRGLAQVQGAVSLDRLNGIEGSAAREYFAGLARVIPAEFGFAGRNRRPALDPVNVLLSIGYTRLYFYMDTLLRVSGLYPWTGFYHQGGGRHAALASDLIEPFRHLVEQTALGSIRKGTLKPGDFSTGPDGGCRLERPGLKRYLELLEKRFLQPVGGLEGNESLPFHQHALRQNRRLIEWIRDPSRSFTAFRMR